MADSITVSNDTGQRVEIFHPEFMGVGDHHDIGTDLGSARIAMANSRLATLDDLKSGTPVVVYTGSGKLPGFFKLNSEKTERAA